jgi:hypothetical protein
MDNDTPQTSVPRTDSVKTGDRTAAGIAVWLTFALILVVVGSQFGPLKRYLTASPPPVRMPEAAAPVAIASLPPPAPTVVEPPPSPAPQTASPPDAAVAEMTTLMLKEPPPSAQVAAQPPQPVQPLVPTGHAGLVEAMRKGLLRPASGGDLAIWKSRWSQANGRGVPGSFDERTMGMETYVIQRDFEIPGDLYGAHAVIFVLGKGVPYPRGDAGHSVVLDQATGACIGPVCGMLLQ